MVRVEVDVQVALVLGRINDPGWNDVELVDIALELRQA